MKRADEVLQALRTDIIRGAYRPGDRLTEPALSAAYGVSRVPIREALRHLETEGFVTSVAYAGMRVAQIDKDEALDLFAVRQTIEELAVRRSAERFSRHREDPEVAAFGDSLASLVQDGQRLVAASDQSGLPELNTRFHLGIAEFGGSTSLLALLRQISGKIQWLYALDVGVRGQDSWCEHNEIASAICSGEAGRAAELMGQHVQNSLGGYLARHLPGADGA